MYASRRARRFGKNRIGDCGRYRGRRISARDRTSGGMQIRTRRVTVRAGSAIYINTDELTRAAHYFGVTPVSVLLMDGAATLSDFSSIGHQFSFLHARAAYSAAPPHPGVFLPRKSSSAAGSAVKASSAVPIYHRHRAITIPTTANATAVLATGHPGNIFPGKRDTFVLLFPALRSALLDVGLFRVSSVGDGARAVREIRHRRNRKAY